jgi:hypothetical protein
MADANFERKSVKELQNYLKERGVIFSDLQQMVYHLPDKNY